MREAEYTRAIHRLLPRDVYAWKISDRFSSGVPDAWYCGVDGDIWVEYKYVAKLPKFRITLKLSALQKKWLNERYKQNRNVYVILGTPKGGVIIQDKQWNDPIEINNHKLLSKKEIADWITTKTAPKTSH